jgi:5-methylcytosine-specific restriction protein B
LIEESKRKGAEEELLVTLPYSGKKFGVPQNVYIIGTMNTADRSIATLDTALRRRFYFKEMLPNPDVLAGIEVGGVSISNLLERINKRIEVLYDREHTIGHSYFMALKKDPSIDALARIFENNIIPLLQEYFYEDYEKIRLVLGDSKKADKDTMFIIAEQNDYSALFGNVDIGLDDGYSYKINKKAFTNIEAYKSI